MIGGDSSEARADPDQDQQPPIPEDVIAVVDRIVADPEAAKAHVTAGNILTDYY